MTPEQSKQLKVGDRVIFNGDPADSGKVTAVEARYVTIKWDDGHESFTGHRGMQRVELVGPRRVKHK
jgi:preprotein translocase subunit YajC